MRTSRAKRTTRARRQRVGTKKARSKRGTRSRKTRGSRARKLSETLSLPEELIETLSSVLQGPKKSVKGKRPVIEMETSSEPAKKSKTKKKSKKKKSKKPKAWHSKIHGKKSKKGKKKKHKKKMKGGSVQPKDKIFSQLEGFEKHAAKTLGFTASGDGGAGTWSAEAANRRVVELEGKLTQRQMGALRDLGLDDELRRTQKIFEAERDPAES